MRSMQPRTRILGIQIEEHTNGDTGEKERFFVKPAPESYAIHWKNYAKKLKVQADPTAYTGVMEKMMYRVPRYNGIDNKLLRYLISAQKYAAKLDRRKNGIPEPEPKQPPSLLFDHGAWVPVSGSTVMEAAS
jgi:hypothetical protein